MDFTPTPEQDALTKSVAQACEPFDDDYWSEHDREARFPESFQAGDSVSFSIIMDEVSVAMKLGELRPGDALEITLTLWSLVHGLASLYRSGRFGEHPRRFRELSRRAVERLLAGGLSA